jgi:hypothetical protein
MTPLFSSMQFMFFTIISSLLDIQRAFCFLSSFPPFVLSTIHVPPKKLSWTLKGYFSRLSRSYDEKVASGLAISFSVHTPFTQPLSCSHLMLEKTHVIPAILIFDPATSNLDLLDKHMSRKPGTSRSNKMVHFLKVPPHRAPYRICVLLRR